MDRLQQADILLEEALRIVSSPSYYDDNRYARVIAIATVAEALIQREMAEPVEIDVDGDES